VTVDDASPAAPWNDCPERVVAALPCGKAGSRAVLFSVARFIAGAVEGRVVLIPTVLMDRLRRFLPFLFGDAGGSKPEAGGEASPCNDRFIPLRADSDFAG
jgi:hypothetical protein